MKLNTQTLMPKPETPNPQKHPMQPQQKLVSSWRLLDLFLAFLAFFLEPPPSHLFPAASSWPPLAGYFVLRCSGIVDALSAGLIANLLSGDDYDDVRELLKSVSPSTETVVTRRTRPAKLAINERTSDEAKIPLLVNRPQSQQVLSTRWVPKQRLDGSCGMRIVAPWRADNSPSNSCPHKSSTPTESKRAVKQVLRYLAGTHKLVFVSNHT